MGYGEGNEERGGEKRTKRGGLERRMGSGEQGEWEVGNKENGIVEEVG